MSIRRLNIACVCVVALVAAVTAVPGAAQTTTPSPTSADAQFVPADPTENGWRNSYAAGKPYRGFLVRGIQLPLAGEDFFTWDFPKARSPNRPWRRWGTDTTIATTLRILAEHRAANPWAPRVGIADLSRPYGGPFGRRFGGLGHASHQNGLDVDILYPRRDARELPPAKPSQVDLGLSQDLVDRLVGAGAVYVFVGPSLRLAGPRRVVQKLVHHDNHIHVRFPRRPRSGPGT
jgi:murein endopeptidase